MGRNSLRPGIGDNRFGQSLIGRPTGIGPGLFTVPRVGWLPRREGGGMIEASTWISFNFFAGLGAGGEGDHGGREHEGEGSVGDCDGCCSPRGGRPRGEEGGFVLRPGQDLCQDAVSQCFFEIRLRQGGSPRLLSSPLR